MRTLQTAPACVLLALAAGPSSCRDQRPPKAALADWIVPGKAAPKRQQAPPVEWVRTIQLEETEAVVNVLPVVQADPRGGFLVADAAEAQIRRYDEDGKLLWHLGRKGRGPLEFQSPQAVVRLPTGEIFVSDSPRRLLLLNAEGTEAAAELDTHIERLEGAVALGDSRLLVSGIVGAADRMMIPSAQASSPRLHVMDMRSGSVVRSFFRPFAGYDTNLAVMAGSVSFSVQGDVIAAAALPKDSLYLLSVGGTPLDKFRLPTENFRVVEPLDPVDFRDPKKRQAWLNSFDTVTSVYWINHDTLVVQYRSVEGNESRWNLLGLTRWGERLFEWADAPRLLTVMPETGLLIFQDPHSLTPDRWAFAKLPF